MAAEPAPAAAAPQAATTLPHPSHGAGEADAASGLAHVAVASFLASRLVPAGGFAVALAGGAALARAGQRQGVRGGYGTSIAALAQTVAIMGPSRFSIPLTQALSAPLLGAMDARGRGVLAQSLACGLIRVAHAAAGLAFFVWIVLGGLAVYADGYDVVWDWVPGVPEGIAGAVAFTAAGILVWTVVATAIQVWIYRRALRHWPVAGEEDRAEGERGAARGALAPAAPAGTPAAPAGNRAALPALPGRRAADRPAARRMPRFDPRAVALAAALAFAGLLLSTAWPVLVAATVWLAGAWALARGEREFLLGGLVLTVLLATGALLGGLLADVGLDLTLRRTARAALLVLVATWLRCAAGEEGLREVARRTLGRLRSVPAAPEAAAVLERLGSGRALPAAGRRLAGEVRHARRRPAPLAAAILRWIAAEQTRFRALFSPAGRPLRAGSADVALVLLALAPAVALVATAL